MRAGGARSEAKRSGVATAGLIALAWLSASAAAAQSPAEVDYALQCRGCHGPDGAGVPGHVPSLAGVAALLATPEGRARLLAVPGVRQASLSDERLAALLAWSAARFAPPGQAQAFGPLSAEEVARYRGTRRGNQAPPSAHWRGTSQTLR